MDGDWSQIYLYVAGRTCRRWRKSDLPEDIRVDSHSAQPTADLDRLKEWLYYRRTTMRQETERTEKRQQKEEEIAKREEEQLALLEF